MDYSKLVGAFYVGIRAGLIDEKHYRKMGSAIWLFMWCVHRQTSVADGKGIVMRGQAVTYEQIHAETGYAVGTIRDWMRTLKTERYVATKNLGNGVQIWVLGQKKTKGRVLKPQQSRVLKPQQSGVKSQHSKAATLTNDMDLFLSPNISKHLQDNTTAASLKPLADSISLPFRKQTEKETEQRRQALLRQAEAIQKRYATARPA